MVWAISTQTDLLANADLTDLKTLTNRHKTKPCVSVNDFISEIKHVYRVIELCYCASASKSVFKARGMCTSNQGGFDETDVNMVSMIVQDMNLVWPIRYACGLFYLLGLGARVWFPFEYY